MKRTFTLGHYIEYKARLEGINPAYTSQICPNCGIKNKAKDRKYICICGYEKHRDCVEAINIAKTVIDGNSLSA